MLVCDDTGVHTDNIATPRTTTTETTVFGEEATADAMAAAASGETEAGFYRIQEQLAHARELKAKELLASAPAQQTSDGACAVDHAC